MFLSQKEKNASDLDHECFLAILADGSTDKSNTEEEMVYVSMLSSQNRPDPFILFSGNYFRAEMLIQKPAMFNRQNKNNISTRKDKLSYRLPVKKDTKKQNKIKIQYFQYHDLFATILSDP